MKHRELIFRGDGRCVKHESDEYDWGKHGKAKLHAFTKQSLVKSFDCEAPCAALRHGWLWRIGPRSLGYKRGEDGNAWVWCCNMFQSLTLRFWYKNLQTFHLLPSRSKPHLLLPIPMRNGGCNGWVSLRSVGHWRLRRLCCFTPKMDEVRQRVWRRVAWSSSTVPWFGVWQKSQK